MKPCNSRRAFTLIELLVVIAIVAILAALLFPELSRVTADANEVKTLSNMRQMGTAMVAFSNDNGGALPSRVTSSTGDTSAKWPTLLKPYIQNLSIYSSPIPDVNGKSYRVTDQSTYFDDGHNNTSYIYNGMNDVGAFGNASYTPHLNMIAQPGKTILLGIPYPQTGQFYMDFEEGAGNNNDVLNRTAFTNASVYMFCDGSARTLTYNAASATYQKQEPPDGKTYTDWLWLLNKQNTADIQ